MRIAISGSHCSGKSTLVDAFLRSHVEYTNEPEPYAVLVEDLGEEFAAEPTAEDFLRQLEFNFERLGLYSAGDRVIFERCPADFLAYMLALQDLGPTRNDRRVFEAALSLAANAIRQLDLIAYVPVSDIEIDIPEEEDPMLRETMDRQLSAILLDDSLRLFTTGALRVIELMGSTSARLRTLEGEIS